MPKKVPMPGALTAVAFLAGLLLSPLIADAGRIDAGLATVLEHSSPDEHIPVIVTLSDRVDTRRFRDRSDRRAARADIVRQLKEKARSTQTPLKQFLKQAGLSSPRELWIINGLALEVPAHLIEVIALRPDVETVTLDASIPAPVVAAAPSGTPEWNITAVGAPDLWALGFTGAGVTIATFDTGVDPLHPDIGPKFRNLPNDWYDPNGQHATPFDETGHGTSVMGVLLGGDAGGTAIGVAPDAQWIAAKIFNDAGSASFTAIHSAFQWALDPDGDPSSDDAPSLLNNSWGLGAADECLSEFEPDIQALRNAGIAVVFAAGNTGPNSSTSVSPANNPGTLSVGAVDQSILIAPFSARGPSTCDGRLFPDLVAPGIPIYTADLTLGGTSPSPYRSIEGTSFSAPHVSGAMALLLQACPDTPIAGLEETLRLSAVDLGTPGPDNDYGHGFLDILAAYQGLNGTPNLQVLDSAPPDQDLILAFANVPVGTSAEQSFSLANIGCGPLDLDPIDASALQPQFSIVADSCSARTLLPGVSCALTISFSPETHEPFSDTLVISSNDPAESFVTLSLTGTGNTSPPAPRLASPADGETGLGTSVSFQWYQDPDADGDPVENFITIWTDTGVPFRVQIAASFGGRPLLAGLGGFVSLFGLAWGLARERRLSALLLLPAILLLAISCGGGGGGGGSSGGDVPAPPLSHTLDNLLPATTYNWQIEAEDGFGGISVSPVRTFSTAP